MAGIAKIAGAGFAAVASILGSGCVSAPALPARAYFQDAKVNGKPVTLAMDSGAMITWFRQEWARRDGVPLTTIPDVTINEHGKLANTAPLEIAVGEQRMSASATVYLSSSEPFLIRTAVSAADLLATTWGFDGAIGWRELRDNILVIDGEKNTITAAAALPPEVATWTSFRIRDDVSTLCLEVPLADGRTLDMYVDTGSPAGLNLPADLWDQWVRDHPRADIGRGIGIAPGAKLRTGYGAFAESFPLGPLVLTDLRIANEKADEGAAPRLGLGLHGLTRLRLVLDYKGGFAYIQPLPAVVLDEPVAPKDRPDAIDRKVPPQWKVDPSVRIDVSSLRAIGLVNEGMILERQKDRVDAVYKYEDAIRLQPDAPDGYFAINRAYLADNHPEIALAEYARMMAEFPGRKSAYNARGVLKSQMSNLDGAISDLDQAIAIDPQFAEAYLNRGNAFFGKGDTETGIRDLTTAIGLQPWRAGAYYSRAGGELDLGDLAGSKSDLDAGLRLEPGNAEWMAQRSRVQLRLGNYDDAAADADRAVKLDDHEDLAHVARASIAMIRGDFKLALAEDERAIELDPSTSSYQQIYRELLRRRLNRNPAGSRFVLDAKVISNEWINTICRFVAGAIPDSEFLAAADRAGPQTPAERKSEANYFIGLVHLVAGDTSSARRSFETAAALVAPQTGAPQFAKAELARLAKP